jgi:hypothetical protein
MPEHLTQTSALGHRDDGAAKSLLDEMALAARTLDQERDPGGTITYYVDRIKYILLEGNALRARNVYKLPWRQPVKK